MFGLMLILGWVGGLITNIVLMFINFITGNPVEGLLFMAMTGVWCGLPIIWTEADNY